MPLLKTLIPLLSVAALTLLAVLPLGLPVDARFVMPLLPYTAVHFWAVRRPALMPEWGVFLAGLTTDVLTNGPLGFWSLMFLAGVVSVDATRDMPEWGALGRWGQFCVTIAVMGVVEWIVASIYFVQVADWKPVVLAATIAAVCYPAISFALRPLLRLCLRVESSRPDNTALTRGA
jgi:rod shape-determining protein MreD